MRKVDISKFRNNVISIVESNRAKITELDIKDDLSLISFSGTNYSFVAELTDKWIGYDLDIDTPMGSVCGVREDTDLYPIHGGTYEEVALEIYDELLYAIDSIFNDRIYYSYDETHSYTAIDKGSGVYTVKYWEDKKFLFWKYRSGWTKDYTEDEISKLNLQVLS